MTDESDKAEIRYLRRDIDQIAKDFRAFRQHIKDEYVSKESNWFVRALVIGVASIILTSFLVVMVGIVISGKVGLT